MVLFHLKSLVFLFYLVHLNPIFDFSMKFWWYYFMDHNYNFIEYLSSSSSNHLFDLRNIFLKIRDLLSSFKLALLSYISKITHWKFLDKLVFHFVFNFLLYLVKVLNVKHNQECSQKLDNLLNNFNYPSFMIWTIFMSFLSLLHYLFNSYLQP